MPSELKDRIAEALAESGKSKAELARYCQVAPASVTAWFNGKTKSLDAVSAIKAAMFLGVNALWLTTGKGEKAAGVGEIYEEESTPDGFVEIPEYEITFGAGDCFTPSYEEVTKIRRALYREDWLKSQGVKSKDCRRFKVHGDSMVPILFDGDRILCDCRPGQKIVNGKIYIFCYGESVRVKRLYAKLNGSIVVHSENPAEQPQDEVIEASDLDRFFLVGRVIERSGSAPF